MKPTRLLLLVCAAALPWLTGCADVSASRTEALSDRIDRQDSRIDQRATRRTMRAQAEDRRYDDWYDRVMGNPQSLF